MASRTPACTGICPASGLPLPCCSYPGPWLKASSYAMRVPVWSSWVLGSSPSGRPLPTEVRRDSGSGSGAAGGPCNILPADAATCCLGMLCSGALHYRTHAEDGRGWLRQHCVQLPWIPLHRLVAAATPGVSSMARHPPPCSHSTLPPPAAERYYPDYTNTFTVGSWSRVCVQRAGTLVFMPGNLPSLVAFGSCPLAPWPAT